MTMNKDKMTWYDVTLYQFLKLQDLIGIEDETERVISIAELLLGNDITDLPLKEFNEQVKRLDFLKDDIPSKIPPKKIEINHRKYYLDCLLGNVSTAQYVDFTNHSNTGDLCKMLSVFVIPEGHKYNDGYDMLEVMNDINDMPIPVANSIGFFFGKHYSTFMRTFQSYSIRKIKETNLPKDKKKTMIEMVKKSMDLALYPLSSNSVK